MLRTAMGAFEALSGTSGINRVYARIPRSARGGQAWARQKAITTPRTSTVPWHHRTRGLSNASRPLTQTTGRTSQTGSPRMLQPRSAVRGGARRNFHSSRARRSAETEAKEADVKPEAEPTSFSARMRKLSREYGWATVGVYLGLTLLDFPFCFLLVRTLGTDRIAAAEHIVVSNVAKVIPDSVKLFWHEYRDALKKAEVENLGNNEISNDVEMVGWGVKEADERNKEEASLATQLALAYAIHKSFIFVRVPLTAALTPKVVKVLRGWGWQIGKRKTTG